MTSSSNWSQGTFTTTTFTSGIIVVSSGYVPPGTDWVWQSAEVGEQGCGFPSAGRELALIPRNLNDPNHYYTMLGLVPWASQRAIRKVCRTLLVKFHPDGEVPNRRLFERYEEIYRILTNRATRQAYHNTPPGAMYADSVVRKQVYDDAARHGITPDDLADAGVFFGGDQRRLTDPNRFGQQQEKIPVGPPPYDYLFRAPHGDQDGERAQAWYFHLLEAAWSIGYTGILKVLLTDADFGYLSRRSGIVQVPRSFEPSPEQAVSLLQTTH